MGSYSKDPTTFKVALEITAKIFQYGEKLGYHLTVVDVGGGFPACAGPAEVELFKRQASAINEGLQQYFSAYQNLKIIGEPGAYVCVSVQAPPLMNAIFVSIRRHMVYTFKSDARLRNHFHRSARFKR